MMTGPSITLAICIAVLTFSPVAAQQPAGTPSPKPGTAIQAPAPAPARPAPAPQTAPATTPGAAAPAPAAPPRTGQPVNVKVEVTITDQRGGAQMLKKTVTVVTGDNMGGFIRANAHYLKTGVVPLNVDTEPMILPDGKIRLRVNLQYDLPTTTSESAGDSPVAGPLVRTQIQENLALILESGKPLIAAQSADPVGDRQVTIEVKATVLK